MGRRSATAPPGASRSPIVVWSLCPARIRSSAMSTSSVVWGGILHAESTEARYAVTGGVLTTDEMQALTEAHGGEVYARIVGDLREAISTEELASVVGVHARQV